MAFSETYKNSKSGDRFPGRAVSGRNGWRSPSNIALVKYWGKRSLQLPMNPSISFTLKGCFTETTIEYEFNPERPKCELQYHFEGTLNENFYERVHDYLKNLKEYIPVISKLRLNISSSNSFPHSAGIASSASAYSALALCLLDIEQKIQGKRLPQEEFYRRASFLARLGSGSASRSLYGYSALWGSTPDMDISSDEFAVGLEDILHEVFMDYQDTILILDDRAKQISSSQGHAFMEKNPYAEVRYAQAKKNTTELYHAFRGGDLMKFINITEKEALSLHAMMLTSSPAFFLMQPATIELIRLIREYRKESGIPVCFTLDAGPNIHILYPNVYRDKIHSFIRERLVSLCPQEKIIYDGVGSGPVSI